LDPSSIGRAGETSPWAALLSGANGGDGEMWKRFGGEGKIKGVVGRLQPGVYTFTEGNSAGNDYKSL
jgi:hypothetical protein